MNGPGRTIGPDALHQREREILALADAGVARDTIAQRLALKREYVGAIITRYSHSEARDRSVEADIRAASQTLAAACIATGSCFR